LIILAQQQGSLWHDSSLARGGAAGRTYKVPHFATQFQEWRAAGCGPALKIATKCQRDDQLICSGGMNRLFVGLGLLLDLVPFVIVHFVKGRKRIY
jgi:hypothetical protein